MSLRVARKRKGYTVPDLSQLSNIQQERLYGLENHRRRLNAQEAETLGNLLDVSPDELLAENKMWAETPTNLLEAIEQYGQFYHTDQVMYLPSFVNLLNDLWQWMWNESFTWESEIADETWKRRLMTYLIRRHSQDDLYHKSFAFTVNRLRTPSVAWVDCYVPPLVNIPTVVFEHISGTSVINGAECFVPHFVNEWLIPHFGCKNLEYKEKGQSYQDAIFLDRCFEHDEIVYTEIKIIDKVAQFQPHVPFTPPGPLEPRSRIYRTITDGSTLPEPFPEGDGDDRCSHERCGQCPLVTGKEPDEANGCERCRGMALTWRARTWLVSKITDDQLRAQNRFNPAILEPCSLNRT
nr:helix-turn-helix transcriptional regulator [Fredinandcohnia onubensis]